MSTDKLKLIPSGTEFYAIEPGYKPMFGVFLQTGEMEPFFYSSKYSIHRASAADIMAYYRERFLEGKGTPSTMEPLFGLYVAKGTFQRNSLGWLLKEPDQEIARIGTPEPFLDHLDLLPRGCPCYIKIGQKTPWYGLTVREAPRQCRTSGFFSEDGWLHGATPQDALKAYLRRNALVGTVPTPFECIYLAEGPLKDITLAHLFERKESVIRDCLKTPVEPSPIIRDDLRRIESANLKALVKHKVTVRATLANIGFLEGTLESDGTFTYDDEEVGHMGLNSFEVLWFLKRRDTNAVIVPLQSRIELDPEYALRFIFFNDKSLLQHLDDKATAPTPVPSYESLLEGLEAKERALLAEIKTLEEIEERKARIRNLTNRRDELKSHLDE
jgi:hypothetical protein